MDLAVVIVSWNTGDLLESCLKSLAGDPFHSRCEIWVVDNASTDGSAEMVRANHPEVHLVESRRNLGFARASNLAAKLSKGKAILFLNPDTEVRPGALEALWNAIDANVAVGAVGPLLLNTDGSLQPCCYPAPTLLGEAWRLFHLDSIQRRSSYDMAVWPTDAVRTVEGLQGACILVRRQAFDEVVGFDEDYFMYSEEVDLCHRLRKAGWTIHWLPEARVIHHGGQSSRQAPMESFLHLYRGKVTYFRKQHGALAAVAYKVILTAASLARLLMTPVALLQKKDQRKRNLGLSKRYGRLLVEMPRL